MQSVTEITPEPTEAEKEAHRRTQFIQSLRDCADWLEQHPDVRAPRYVDMNVFVDTLEDVASHARAATWEKIYNGQFFYLRRWFGPDLNIDIAAPREAVCRRVVVGKKTVPATPEHDVEIVEWICDDPAVMR
jgi:hypothetical protein